jgi:hypothetical protein
VDEAHNLLHFAAGALHLLVVEVGVGPDVFDLVSNPAPVLIHFFRRHKSTSLVAC